MLLVTRETRLSQVRALVSRNRKADDAINPRSVADIQQSLAVEGYEVTEDAVRQGGRGGPNSVP